MPLTRPIETRCEFCDAICHAGECYLPSQGSERVCFMCVDHAINMLRVQLRYMQRTPFYARGPGGSETPDAQVRLQGRVTISRASKQTI